MKKSLTLAELLMAVLFIGIVISGLLLMFANCMIANESNRNLTVAISHAQYILEEIRDIDDPDDVANNTTLWNWTVDNDFTSRGLQRLKNETTTVSCCAANGTTFPCVVPAADPLGIAVNVTWFNMGKRTRSIEFRTLITEY